MAISIVTQGKDVSAWLQALKAARPNLKVYAHPEEEDKNAVTFALAWNHPSGIFRQYPNLKAISSMGAGVDHILRDPNLPEDVTIARIIDEDLSQDMAEFVTALVLQHTRGLQQYSRQQKEQQWQPQPYKRARGVRVGIMGLGVLGTQVAAMLAQVGFTVSGWARHAKEVTQVQVYAGAEEQAEFLKNTDVLVCLLPLTDATRGILNKETLRQLPQGAYVVNVARGEHIVDEDLIDLIDNGHLAGASLDVFGQEPLPQDHPFWSHPKVFVTPHIASVTDPASVVPQVLANYDRAQKGEALQNVVSQKKGY